MSRFRLSCAACGSVLLGPLLAGGWSGGQGSWSELVESEGSFRIQFPAPPKTTVREMETGAGRLTSRSYALEEGPISFLVSWLEFPPQYVRDTGEVALLNGAKEAFLKRLKGEVLREKIVSLEVAPGRDVLFATEDEVRLRLRMFLRGRKLVQTLVIAEPDLVDGADAKRFFDSLKWD
jgi:hypothetical protein